VGKSCGKLGFVSEERITSIFRVENPRARNQSEQVAAGSSLADFSSLKMEAIVPLKRRFTQDLQGATSQKTAFFIVTAVKTSNLTTGIVSSDKGSIHCLTFLLRALNPSELLQVLMADDADDAGDNVSDSKGNSCDVRRWWLMIRTIRAVTMMILL
jgi:hypothetical protein